MSNDLLAASQVVFRPDIYDAVLGPSPPLPVGEPDDGVGAFASPAFNAADIAGHLAAWPAHRE